MYVVQIGRNWRDYQYFWQLQFFHLRKYYRNICLIRNMCLYDLWKVKLELTAYLKFLLLLSRKKISHVCSTQPNYSSEKTKVILFNFVAYTGDSFHSHDVRGVVWRFHYYSLNYRFAIFSSHSLSLSLNHFFLRGNGTFWDLR